MNFVLLIIDTLRYDYIAANGNDWIKTPNLDRLAARSWCFDRAFCSSFPTIPHRTDVMTGIYGGPFYPWRPLRHDHITLPEEMGKAGYRTQLLHDTPHLVNGGHNFDWPFHGWTPIRGAEVDRPWVDDKGRMPSNWARDPLFDDVPWEERRRINYYETYTRSNRNRRSIEDWNTPRLFRTAADWLRDNADTPDYFLWIDCFDPHEPWDVPPDYAKLYADDPNWDGRIDPRAFGIWRTSQAERRPEMEKRVAALYAGKVTWVDHWLGKFLDAMDQTNAWEDTTVLLTADHGTSVGEYGRWGKKLPVREGEAHVPFMIATPRGETGHSDMLVQPHDIFSTIMSLAGLETPPTVAPSSYDLLAAVREGREPRQIAVAGGSADGWQTRVRGKEQSPFDAQTLLFTVFDKEWFFEWSPWKDQCRLTRLGTQVDVAAENPEVVDRLYTAGLAEVAQRDIDPKLLAWLESGGEGDYPEDCVFFRGWPGPSGFRPYFQRLYHGWPEE